MKVHRHTDGFDYDCLTSGPCDGSCGYEPPEETTMGPRHWLPIADCGCAERTDTGLRLCDNHDARVLKAIRDGTIRQEFTPVSNAAEAQAQENAARLAEEGASFVLLGSSSAPEIHIPPGFHALTLKSPTPGTKLVYGGLTVELR